MKNLAILFCVLFGFTQIYAQTLSYSDMTRSDQSLKTYLTNNPDFMTGGNRNLPYYQGINDGVYIKFYDTTGPIAVIDFDNRKDFIDLVNQISRKAYFRFKYCTDYDTPIVYNFITSTKNDIRYNLSDQRISIGYPSKLNAFLDSNSGLLTTFVCSSNDAYAYHTNLKCEGLQNCRSQLVKTTKDEARKYNYRECEICTSLY